MRNKLDEKSYKLIYDKENFRLLFESMCEGFAVHEIILDKGGNPIDYVFLDVNKAFEDITKLKREEILGRSVLDVLPEVEDYWIKYYGEVATTGKCMEFENYSKEMDKYFKVRVFSPEKGKFAVLFVDITDIKHLEKSLIEEKERFKTTLFSIGEAVIATDECGKITIMNRVAEELTGWVQGEAIGKDVEEVFCVIDEHTRKTNTNISAKGIATSNIIALKDNVNLISKNKKEVSISYNVSHIKNKYEIIKGYVLVFRDICAENNKIKQIEYLSYHDQLTGVYNRSFFQEELKRLDNNDSLPLSIIMADVNGLKLTNDAFGHAFGDELLKQVAENIKRACNSHEIVSRVGGDEFIIILPNTSHEEAEKFVEKVRGINQNTNLKGIEISLSLGFSTKNSGLEDIQLILKKSEDYMYKNKVFEGPSIRSRTVETIINTLHEKNKREEMHSRRVSDLCKTMGEVIGLNEREINELKTLGLLHDIGKIAIDEKILNKGDNLTKEEWVEIKRHPEIGYNILRSVSDMTELSEDVLSHHENWDGTGYPRKLKGEEISLKARIIKIIDAYDAMTSDRAYRKALTKKEAIEELKKYANIQFDSKLVFEFITKVLLSE